MRRALWIIAFALAILLARMLIPLAGQTVSRRIADAQEAWARAELHRSPRAFPPRPGDEQRYPRASFGIVYQGWGPRVDTLHGRLVAHSVAGEESLVTFSLNRAEMDTLWRTALAFRLFEFPEPHPAPVAIVPSLPATLIVHAGGTTRELHWESGWTRFGLPSVEDAKRLDGFLRIMGRMLARDAAYVALRSRYGSPI